MRWHPEITVRELVIQRRREAKDNIRKSIGMTWKKYNQELVERDDYNWLDSECRLIVVLNNVLRVKK